MQRSGTGSSPHKQGGVANPKIRIDRMYWARIRPHKQGARTAAGQMRCVPKQPARTTLVHRQVHDVVRPKRPPTSSPPRTSPASSAQRSASIGAMTLGRRLIPRNNVRRRGREAGARLTTPSQGRLFEGPKVMVLMRAEIRGSGEHGSALDAAVAAAHGWPADITDDDALRELLARNRGS